MPTMVPKQQEHLAGLGQHFLITDCNTKQVEAPRGWETTMLASLLVE